MSPFFPIYSVAVGKFCGGGSSALDFDQLKNIPMCDSKISVKRREMEKCWYTSILIKM